MKSDNMVFNYFSETKWWDVEEELLVRYMVDRGHRWRAVDNLIGDGQSSRIHPCQGHHWTWSPSSDLRTATYTSTSLRTEEIH